MTLICVWKATSELLVSWVTLLKNKVQQLIIALLETWFTLDSLSVILRKNSYIHQFLWQPKVWVDHFPQIFFLSEYDTLLIDNCSK